MRMPPFSVTGRFGAVGKMNLTCGKGAAHRSRSYGRE